MIPLILDHRPSYLNGKGASGSLLGMPLGRGTLLSHVVAGVGCEAAEKLVIITTFSPDQAYKERLKSIVPNPMRVVESAQVLVEIEQLEDQDAVCVLDSMCRPLADLDLARLHRNHQGFLGVTHAVAVGTGADHIREHIERDSVGRVKRVARRLGATGLLEIVNETMIASFMPASALRNVRFTSLAALRSELARRGVMSRDVPLSVDVVDLSAAPDLLSLNEWTMLHSERGEGARRNGNADLECYTHETADVHPSVRRIGPVIIQNDVTVAKNVTVIGPTVLGTGSRIAAGVTIAQSLVAAYGHVGPNADVLHRIVSGTWMRDGDSEVPTGLPAMRVGRLGGASAAGSQGAKEDSGAVRMGRAGPMVKRGMDVVLASAGLAVLALPMLIVAWRIKRDSPGPVFFAHLREGKGGREFRCWKFRTMDRGADRKERGLSQQNEADDGHIYILNDPRVTRYGKWLRRTNVDELPQLFNVLCGEMSLVGPRPSPFRENQICVPWRRARLSATPGITGMWQLCRKARSGGDFHQWIFYDLLYVRHQSVWLDIKILAATLVTLGGKWSVPHTWLVRSDASVVGKRADSNNADGHDASLLAYGGLA